MSHWILASPAAGPASLLTSFAPMLIILVIFYFIVFAPIRKRQKALEGLISNLKKGDRVITNGGLHGEVVKVDGDVVLLKLAETVKVRLSKSAVAGLEKPEDAKS